MLTAIKDMPPWFLLLVSMICADQIIGAPEAFNTPSFATEANISSSELSATAQVMPAYKVSSLAGYTGVAL